VICARGKEAFNHPGNARFRAMVQSQLHSYSSSSSKVEKSKIVRDIIESVRRASPQGGFVKQVDGKWFDVGERARREKTGQQIRDLLHTQYKSSTKAKAKTRKTMRTLHDRSISNSSSVSNASTQSAPVSFSTGRSNSGNSLPARIVTVDSQSDRAKRFKQFAAGGRRQAPRHNSEPMPSLLDNAFGNTNQGYQQRQGFSSERELLEPGFDVVQQQQQPPRRQRQRHSYQHHREQEQLDQHPREQLPQIIIPPFRENTYQSDYQQQELAMPSFSQSQMRSQNAFAAAAASQQAFLQSADLLTTTTAMARFNDSGSSLGSSNNNISYLPGMMPSMTQNMRMGNAQQPFGSMANNSASMLMNNNTTNAQLREMMMMQQQQQRGVHHDGRDTRFSAAPLVGAPNLSPMEANLLYQQQAAAAEEEANQHGSMHNSEASFEEIIDGMGELPEGPSYI